MAEMKSSLKRGDDSLADAAADIIEHVRVAKKANYMRICMLDMETSDGTRENWTVIVVRNDVFQPAIMDAAAEHMEMESVLEKHGTEGLAAVYEAAKSAKH